MIYDDLVSEINIGTHANYGITPKFIIMNRKSFEELKTERKDDIFSGVEKNLFFGIPIRIKNIEKNFELRFYVDPLNTK